MGLQPGQKQTSAYQDSLESKSTCQIPIKLYSCKFCWVSFAECTYGISQFYMVQTQYPLLLSVRKGLRTRISPWLEEYVWPALYTHPKVPVSSHFCMRLPQSLAGMSPAQNCLISSVHERGLLTERPYLTKTDIWSCAVFNFLVRAGDNRGTLSGPWTVLLPSNYLPTLPCDAHTECCKILTAGCASENIVASGCTSQPSGSGTSKTKMLSVPASNRLSAASSPAFICWWAVTLYLQEVCTEFFGSFKHSKCASLQEERP